VDVATHHSEASPVTAAAAVVVPLVAVLLVLVRLQRRIGVGFAGSEPLVLVGAVLMLAGAAAASVWNLGLCVLLMGVLLTLMVAVSLVTAARAGRAEVG
jgi:hypothetical protein